MIRVTDEKIAHSWARAKMIFERLSEGVEDMQPVWKEFIHVYQKDLSPKIFNSRGRAILGEKWAAYSPAYLKRRQKSGFKGGQVLVLSGRLKKATMGGPGWYQKLTKDKMKMGVKVKPYWRVHQYGYAKQGIPPRPYFMSDEYTPRAYAYLIKLTRERLDELKAEAK